MLMVINLAEAMEVRFTVNAKCSDLFPLACAAKLLRNIDILDISS